jgi:hypothetical protein
MPVGRLDDARVLPTTGLSDQPGSVDAFPRGSADKRKSLHGLGTGWIIAQNAE